MDEIGNSASEEMPELTETFDQWLCRFHCVL
jgi:hypothetical protein